MTNYSEHSPQHLTVLFRLDSDTRRLKAVISPCDEEQTIDEQWIRSALEAQKHDSLYFFKNDFNDILSKLAHQAVGAEIETAEARDAQAVVNVSEDLMQASISITPCYGGEQITRDDIEDLLQHEGVIEGILDESITEVLAMQPGEVKDHVIAKGLEAVDGTDASFEDLLPEVRATGPIIDESGKADMYSLNEFVVVDPDTPLMRRIPATPGVNGYNIQGKVIAAQAGEDHYFSECEGTTLSKDDENVLIAAIKGYPRVSHHGVSVNPTLELANVDLSTGNVDFDGCLHVKGDIGDGLTVKVTGDVMVDGVIQKATVKAGGSIVVKNGVIGGAPAHEEGDTMVHHGAHLEAVEEIQARFIDNAYLHVGKTIRVREYIRHSHTVSGYQVLLGAEGGRGRLIGGEISATSMVQVNELGTNADVPTYVEVGVDPKLRDEYDALSLQIHELRHDLNGLVLSFSHLTKKAKSADQDTEKIKKELVKVAKKIKSLQDEITQLSNDRQALEQKMEASREAKIVVVKRVHPNVIVKVKDRQYKVHESMTGGTFVLKGDKVDFSK